MKRFIALGFLLLAFSISKYAFCTPDNSIQSYDRLIFYYEILHRVEQPLAFDIWIKTGESLVIDKDYYKAWTESMERFVQAVRTDELLSRASFFGMLVKSHQLQTLGLYHFLIKPTTWEIFVQNACWARQHTHPHMFVYAFTMAVLERDYNNELLPAIYQILPRYFINGHFVSEAEKFDPEARLDWFVETTTAPSSTTSLTDFQAWQWWRMMGLSDTQWYAERRNVIENNIYEARDLIPLPQLRAWWRPADYTRNSQLHSREPAAVLSYLREDVDWTAYWYYLNVQYAYFLEGHNQLWKADLFGEYWFFFVEKYLARYYMERLSHGFGAIPDLAWHLPIDGGYDSQLTAENGVRFEARAPDWLPQSNTAAVAYLKEVREMFAYINALIDAGSYTLRNGTTIDLRQPAAIVHINNLLRGHTDAQGNNFLTHWYSLAHMYFAGMTPNRDQNLALNVTPHVLLNFETMPRDPFFYVFHKAILKLRHRFDAYLPPYSREELHIAGIEVVDLHVTELVTYDDVLDWDVTNLLRNNLTFFNDHHHRHHRLAWRDNLLARQMRLNHKPFTLNVTVASDRHRDVYVRYYLAPKFDEYGQSLSLDENRRNFIELENIYWHLRPGNNVITLAYEILFGRRRKSNYFQAKMYHCARSANYRAYMTVHADESRYCGLHERLLLPRGWKDGMPMQLFVMVTDDDTTSTQVWWRLCSLHVDHRSLGFPFDRHIPNEHDFFGSNMLLKDVKIYHEDTFAHYKRTNHYDRYGEFDYDAFENYEHHEKNLTRDRILKKLIKKNSK